MLNLEKKDFYTCRVSTGELYNFDQPVLHEQAMNTAMGLVFQKKAAAAVVFDGQGKLVGAFFDMNANRSFSDH